MTTQEKSRLAANQSAQWERDGLAATISPAVAFNHTPKRPAAQPCAHCGWPGGTTATDAVEFQTERIYGTIIRRRWLCHDETMCWARRDEQIRQELAS